MCIEISGLLVTAAFRVCAEMGGDVKAGSAIIFTDAEKSQVKLPNKGYACKRGTQGYKWIAYNRLLKH